MEKAARWAIVEAPSILGLRPTGVETLPEALLAAGLNECLGARRAGRVAPRRPYDPVRDPATSTLNAAAIAEHASELADAVGDVLDRGELPLVLGGDCSILLGNLLALKRRGRYGLLFLDGHADFYQPEANPNGEAASMELAFATGRGPELLADLEGRGPLVADEDVVVFGYRDAEEQAAYGSQPLPKRTMAIDLPQLHAVGIDALLRDALDQLTREGGPERFWIHLDADVLSDNILPAVDYRQPGGLAWEELELALRVAIDSGRVAGLDLTIYNPKLDPEGAGARGLAKILAEALARSEHQ